MSDLHTAIVGQGYALPPKIRKNEDPIFNWLHKNQPEGTDLFLGLHCRRVIESPQTVADLMVEASNNALEKAAMQASQVDLLIGYASVSEFNAPNGLLEIHQKMNLSEACRCIAVNSDYTNFLDAMKLGPLPRKSSVGEYSPPRPP